MVEWMAALNLYRYAELFRSKDIKGVDLLSLDKDKLAVSSCRVPSIARGASTVAPCKFLLRRPLIAPGREESGPAAAARNLSPSAPLANSSRPGEDGLGGSGTWSPACARSPRLAAPFFGGSSPSRRDRCAGCARRPRSRRMPLSLPAIGAIDFPPEDSANHRRSCPVDPL